MGCGAVCSQLRGKKCHAFLHALLVERFQGATRVFGFAQACALGFKRNATSQILGNAK